MSLKEHSTLTHASGLLGDRLDTRQLSANSDGSFSSAPSWHTPHNAHEILGDARGLKTEGEPDRICTLWAGFSVAQRDGIIFRFNRFLKRDDSEDGCWPWQGARKGGRYGEIRLTSGVKVAIHRLAFFLANGYLPADLLVCHSCDYPPCGRAKHLSLGTHQQNTQDASAKGRMGRRIPEHIRARIALDTRPAWIVGEAFGCSAVTVSTIRRVQTLSPKGGA